MLVPSHYSLRFDDQFLISLFDDQKDFSFRYWPDPNADALQDLRIPFTSDPSGFLDSLGRFSGSDNTSFVASDYGRRATRKLTLDSDGNLRLYSLSKDGGAWSVTWMAFPQPCNAHGVCGCGMNTTTCAKLRVRSWLPNHRPKQPGERLQTNHQYYDL